MSIFKKNAKYVAAAVVVVAGIVAFQAFTSQAVSGKQEAVKQEAPSEKRADGIVIDREPGALWAMRCRNEEAVKADDKLGKCDVAQTVAVKETGKVFMELAVSAPDEKGVSEGTMLLPFGILLKNGVEMHVDNDQAFRFDIHTCEAVGCIARLNLQDPVIDSFRKGEKLTIEFKNASGKDMKFNMSLKGFSKAYDKVS